MCQSTLGEYYNWLETKVSPVLLADLYLVYADVEQYCRNRHLISSEFSSLASFSEVADIMDRIARDRGFRTAYRWKQQTLQTATRLCGEYLDTHPEAESRETAGAGKLVQGGYPDAQIVPEGTEPDLTQSKTRAPTSADDWVLDWENIKNLDKIRPTRFSYFDEVCLSVQSWEHLFAACLDCLRADYPHVLDEYIGYTVEAWKIWIWAPKERDIWQESARVESLQNVSGEQSSSTTWASAQEILGEIIQLLTVCNVDRENLRIFCTQVKTTHAEKKPAVAASNDGTVATKTDLRQERTDQTAWDERKLREADRFAVDSADAVRDAKQSNSVEESFTKTRKAARPTTSEISSAGRSKKTKAQKRFLSAEEEMQDRCASILSEFFGENGYRPGRAIARGQFRNYYEITYGIALEESDEQLDQIVAMVGATRGERIFPKSNASQNDLLQRIMSDISAAFEVGATTIWFDAVYRKYRQKLATEVQVYEAESLKALLRPYADDDVVWWSHAMTRNRMAPNAEADVVRIARQFHEPVSFTRLSEEAWFVPPDTVRSVLNKTPEIVNVAKETYFYAPNLPVSADELERLAVSIERELSSRTFITASSLAQLINQDYPTIAMSMQGFEAYGLRNCLGVLLKDRFAFQGKIVGRKGQRIHAATVLHQAVLDNEAITLGELKSLSEELDVTISWDAIRRDLVRVSATDFVRKDQIAFDVDAVDRILEDMYPDYYVPLSQIQLFLHFPNVGYRWNSYVLESYLYAFSNKFCLLHSNFVVDGAYGAMVRRDAGIPDYRALLVEVLAASDAVGSEKDALRYIVDAGYQQRQRYTGISSVLREAKVLQEQRRALEA